MDKMFNAFFGTVAPIFGVITSLQDDVEWTLRIASLLIGIAVGCISFIRLIRKL